MSSPSPPAPTRRRRDLLPVEDYEAGLLAGDRAMLGRAITLVESHKEEHQQLAQQLLARLLPRTGEAHRVGITGVPGVGKSTFIETLGKRLTDAGHRVAVLAVDPSSTVSGGSILGDKTRMESLARNPRAFIRPSPTRGSLGGVARKTRETMLLCEAAGYDVILVETVGVGQSEIVVAEMVDFFLLLMLAGAGDELQGIKRGIVEVADLLAITKADGANRAAAERARREYEGALHYLRPKGGNWRPPVLTVSAVEGEGLEALWQQVQDHRRALEASGEWREHREAQRVKWMWSLVEESLMDRFRRHPKVAQGGAEIVAAVESGSETPTRGALRLLSLFSAS
ncbi:MAG: methylmalonyl Co-A mutase-associated GTPase MeaB [Acidobacteriota bacterium]